MDFRLFFAILISKLAIKACRLVNLGGTSLPGEIARKIYPGIIQKLARGFRIIMVTGTNGKTTTTRIIGQILKYNGVEYITNRSGANLVDGIISTFIDNADFRGRYVCRTALLEIDEAAFNRMCDHIRPDILVVTNFFRDQLDRYGELYSTLRGVASGIRKSPGVSLVLNADDSLCSSLGRDIPRETVYYGFDPDSYKGSEEAANSDAMFCIYCKTKYSYHNHIYGHLGDFSCPGCGYRRPAASTLCTKVTELTSSYSSIRFTVKSTSFKQWLPEKKRRIKRHAISYCRMLARPSRYRRVNEYKARINLPGLYNIYNSLAAVACGQALKLPVEKSIKALNDFECGFGRMETINADGRIVKLILVKNPTGFNQVLNYIKTERQNIQLAFIINDRIADGADVSWLWDVEFEKLQSIQERISGIYTSGTRAEDMSVRLKYAGIFTDKINMQKDYGRLVAAGLSKTEEGGSFYILPTYTALLEIRKVLKRKFGLKEFWK